MLTGVLSDEYIKKNCWEYTAPIALGKSILRRQMPVKVANIMEPVSFPIQQASSIVDMAKNVVAITPRKNLPKSENAVAIVADKLKAEISMTPYDPVMVMVIDKDGTQIAMTKEEAMTPYMTAYTQAYNEEISRQAFPGMTPAEIRSTIRFRPVQQTPENLMKKFNEATTPLTPQDRMKMEERERMSERERKRVREGLRDIEREREIEREIASAIKNQAQ